MLTVLFSCLCYCLQHNVVIFLKNTRNLIRRNRNRNYFKEGDWKGNVYIYINCEWRRRHNECIKQSRTLIFWSTEQQWTGSKICSSNSGRLIKWTPIFRGTTRPPSWRCKAKQRHSRENHNMNLYRHVNLTVCMSQNKYKCGLASNPRPIPWVAIGIERVDNMDTGSENLLFSCTAMWGLQH